MKRLLFPLVLTFLASAAFSQSPPPELASLVGTWQFVKSDWKGFRRIDSDGTFSDENGKPKGKWIATASELRLEYGNGNIERFQLPVKKRQMSGISNEGGPLTATKQN